MAFNVYPSVSVDEIDLTTGIPAVDTTGAGFAGVFNWGPVGIAVPVDQESALRAKFGAPDNNNFETWFTAASFLAYGHNLYISRAANTSNDTPGVSYLSAVANSGSITGANSYFTIKNSDDYAAKFANGVLYFAGLGAQYIAKYPGSIGNSLLVSVCDSTEAFSSNIALANVAHGNSTANGVSAASPTVNTNIAFVVGSNQATITLSNATSFTDAHTTALATLLSTVLLSNGDVIVSGNSTIGSQSLQITSIGSVLTVNSTGTNTGVAQFTLNFDNPYRLAANITANTFTRQWKYASMFNAAPGQTSYQKIVGLSNTSANDALDVVIVDQNGKFTGIPGQILEIYQNLSRSTDAVTPQGQTNYYATVINQNSQYVWWADDRSGAVSNTALSLASSSKFVPYRQQFNAGTNGGTESNVVFGDIATAYDVFANPEVADITYLLTGKNDSSGVLSNYVNSNICLKRRDCVSFISPYREAVVNNRGLESANVATFAAAISGTSYSSMSSGYKYMYDKYNDVFRWVPLNGDDAGLCVRTDGQRQPWFSPAGLNRGQYLNCIRLSWNPNAQEQAILYNANVNPSLTFKGKGSFLFGDKTLSVDPTSAFSRLGVRRLFIVLEKAISNFAKFELFEFNDVFTRAQFVAIVNPYLTGVMAARGIYAFKVVCDDKNNPAVIIDAERFVGDIYIKPARSINFINLNFVAVATGVDFNEVVGNFGG